ncbi:MAG: NAD-dependent epimerase/dehydratase family protein [Phycisphaeraceae bacterium]|nr:NAD-dependent epimerase/dehydratase family protein [Phycisphaerae bacterium]MBX3393414.1 NAD-dependent epimerase/dehydratase family protein [Phycisphaeraceae bacterium]
MTPQPDNPADDLPAWLASPALASLRGVRALVTGGAGFIGSHIAHALERLGASVVVLDDLSGGYEANLPPGADFVRSSILDEGALRSAVRGCGVVFHEAALVSVPQSVSEPERCSQVNMVGTQRVLTAATEEGVRRVVFAASAAAYGNNPSLPSREDHVPDCWSPYAASKVAGELMLQSQARCTSLSTVSLRYFNIFGPRQDPASPYAAVISAFIRMLLSGRGPTVMGDGLQTRDFTYIDNVVSANLLAAASPRPFAGEVMNIGTGVRTSLLDVLARMGEALGVDATPTFAPPRAGDVRHSVADISRARDLIGYEPVVDFAEGIRRTLAWARASPAFDSTGMRGSAA